MRWLPCSIGEGSEEARRQARVPGPAGAGPLGGSVAFGGACIVLQLHTDAHGLPLVVPRNVVVGVEDLADCRLRRGIFSDRLHLRGVSMATFGGVSGASYDGVTLRFSKKHRAEVEALVERIGRIMRQPLAPVALEGDAVGAHLRDVG
jgi:hypothetical protein